MNKILSMALICLCVFTFFSCSKNPELQEQEDPSTSQEGEINNFIYRGRGKGFAYLVGQEKKNAHVLYGTTPTGVDISFYTERIGPIILRSRGELVPDKYKEFISENYEFFRNVVLPFPAIREVEKDIGFGEKRTYRYDCTIVYDVLITDETIICLAYDSFYNQEVGSVDNIYKVVVLENEKTHIINLSEKPCLGKWPEGYCKGFGNTVLIGGECYNYDGTLAFSITADPQKCMVNSVFAFLNGWSFPVAEKKIIIVNGTAGFFVQVIDLEDGTLQVPILLGWVKDPVKAYPMIFEKKDGVVCTFLIRYIEYDGKEIIKRITLNINTLEYNVDVVS